jgi:hypothetical protein
LATYAYRGRRVNTTPTVRYLPSAPPEPEPEPEPEPTPDLNVLLKYELVELAEARGLSTEGTRNDLIERLSDG